MGCATLEGSALVSRSWLSQPAGKKSWSTSHCALPLGKEKDDGYSLHKREEEDGGKGGGVCRSRRSGKEGLRFGGEKGRGRHGSVAGAMSAGGTSPMCLLSPFRVNSLTFQSEHVSIYTNIDTCVCISASPVQDVLLEQCAVGILAGRRVDERGAVGQAEAPQKVLHEVLPLRLLEAAALLHGTRRGEGAKALGISNLDRCAPLA